MLALGVIASPALALAQSQSPATTVTGQVPVREGNTWGGADHDPTPGEVLPAEKAAGIAPSAKRDAKVNKKLDKLYEQLMGSPPAPAPAQ